MSEKRIPYSVRDYNGCRQQVLNIMRKYYPDVFNRIDDASVGQWLVDVMADIYDNLNFHADRLYQETSVDSATELASLQNIARTKGIKLPGKKAALCEIELSCVIPLTDGDSTNYATAGGGGYYNRIADERYCPVIKKGTLFSTGSTTFELMNDVDFAKQFNTDGYSDRQIIPMRNANNVITSYTYKKLAVVQAGQSKVYKRIINRSDIKPFLEITLKDKDILGVESVIVKDGTSFSTDPKIDDYMTELETHTENGVTTTRFFEVDNLIDQYRFGDVYEESEGEYNPVIESVSLEVYDGDEKAGDVIVEQARKGEWKRLKHKFVSEYTDDWFLKLTFGAGIENEYGKIPADAANFTKYMMSRMMANDYMGVLPKENSTMYVLYRIGGGEKSNIAKGSLNNIIYLNMDIEGDCGDVANDSMKKRNVRNSLSVTNTTPSYGGKDEPNEDEIRYMLKYNNTSQNRCVTINDYYSVLNNIPARYGSPYRYGVLEENNKIGIYALGLDDRGKLTNILSEYVANNMKEYLKKYKTINDFVEIRSGRIINVAFKLSVCVDKSYDKGEVVKRVIDTVYDYMDIRKHQMGEDIYLGDLSKEIGKLDGVLNLISLRVYNRVGGDYSDDATVQQLVNTASCCTDFDDDVDLGDQIDLNASDMTLVGDPISMYEIKNINADIRVAVKTR